MRSCPYCRKELYYNSNSGYYNCRHHSPVEVKFLVGFLYNENIKNNVPYVRTYMYVHIDKHKDYELIIEHQHNMSELGYFYKDSEEHFPGFHSLMVLPSAVNVAPEQLVDRIKTWLTFS